MESVVKAVCSEKFQPGVTLGLQLNIAYGVNSSALWQAVNIDLN